MSKANLGFSYLWSSGSRFEMHCIFVIHRSIGVQLWMLFVVSANGLRFTEDILLTCSMY